MNNTMKPTILVTGGAGYIGSHTVNALIESGYAVVIIDNLVTGYEKLLHPEAKFYQVDIRDTIKITEIMKEENIQGVIHFAALIVVPDSITHALDYYHNNTYGVMSVLTACKKAHVRHFVFSSTAMVYEGSDNTPLDETLRAAPPNPYGFSKLMSEQIIRDCEKDFELKSIIFRYFNVAGANSSLRFGQISKNATHLIKIASEAALGLKDSMNITGTDYPTPDGTGVRDYVHVDDLAHAHVLAMNHLLDGGDSDLFNCGYGHGYSVREVITCMKKVTGNDFKTYEAPRRPGDVAFLVANPKKLMTKLNWKPQKDDLELICKSAYLFEKNL